jgi:acyl-CoA reductase-like NAD-dependent aldehyde dehydrogenase
MRAALGSLISPSAGARVETLVGDALSKGAKLSAGKASFEGAIVQPMVLEDVAKGMDIYYQESFGPVVSLFQFDTNNEAIQLANDTEYGLVCSVFSDNITEALAVGRKIRSGSCHINGATVHGKLLFSLNQFERRRLTCYEKMSHICHLVARKLLDMGVSEEQLALMSSPRIGS